MLQEIERLLVIQDRDRRIRTLQMELKKAPVERKGLEAKLAAANGGLEAAKQKVRDLEIKRKNLQTEAQAKRDQIGRFKTQQMQTRKNEEYQALTNEIKHFESEVVKIEDAELEVMEELEKANAAVEVAAKQAEEARGVVAKQIADLDAKVASFKGQLAEVEAERGKLVIGVDEDLLEVYTRLFNTKGGDAVVPLEHEVCMGCHMKLTTQTALKVRSEKVLTHCEQCGRILYLPQ